MGSTGTGTIVIVGAGLSGLRTAERLRRLGHDGPVTLVGDEPHPPYDRPPLSKGLLTQADEPAAAVPLRTAPYADLGIDLRLGVRATALDTSGNRLVLAGGEELHYGRLVIATGLRPRVLAALTAGPAGVHTLRSFDDLLSLRAGLRGARRVTVAGAGVLGCEIAAAARARGAEVTLVEALEQPMLGALGARVGEFVAALHRARGVRVLCSTRIRGLEGRDRVERVVLEDGSVLPTDLVVAAVGAVPETGWLEGSGLELGDGVVCDGTGRTSAEDVWAVGDIARTPHPHGAGTVRLEHWTNAADGAALVAANLLAAPGEAREATETPYFWSDQYDLKIQCLGLPRADDDLMVTAGAPDSHRLLGLYSREGRVTGAVAMGMPAALARCRAAVASRTALNELLDEAPWDRGRTGRP
ncbi:NAD(P)/FAD-dependent oxidoreductase [Actinomadura welshii]|uniref:NAD(P)/FAD-dependent oxidoreductase n=1 Tax=Actinomadura welshii TaxID=3103817 RepID=UPI0003ACE4F2|nr:FAD-dependent oxidoreductase [Actinomadura madurae]